MKEIWKTIKYFENYAVSNFGRVKRIKSSQRTHNGKIINQYLNNAGYYCVNLRSNKKSYYRTVHRLVAEAFIPNLEEKTDVDHIDDNKTNNKVENLQWLTHKENMQKMWKFKRNFVQSS